MAITVPVNFEGDFNDALASFKKFSSGVQGHVEEINGAFEKVKLAAEAVVAAFAIEKIVEGIKDLAFEGAKAQDALVQMGNSLRAAGDYSERNVQAFQALADTLSETSRFSETEILSQVSLAKQFNLTNQEAAKLISTSVDLAQVTGKDLNTVVLQLGRTFSGTTGRLAQQFPEIKNLTKAQLEHGAAIDVLAKKYKGFAEQGLQTFNGQVAQSRNTLEKLKETLGSAISDNPAVLKSFSEFTGMMRDLVEYVKENKTVLAEYIKDGLVFGIEAVKGLTGAFKYFIDTLIVLGGVLKADYNILSGLYDLKHGNFSDGIDSIKAGFKDLAAIPTSIDKFNAPLNTLYDKIGGIANRVDAVQIAGTKFFNSVTGAYETFDKLSPSLKRTSDELKTQYEELAKKLRDVGVDAVTTQTNAYKRQQDIIAQGRAAGFGDEVSNRILIGKLELEYVQKVSEARRKQYAEMLAKVQEAFNNPINGFRPSEDAYGQGSLHLNEDQQRQGAAVLGVTNQLLQGAAGAKNLLISGASAVASIWLGPLGQVVGQIVGEFASGPEHIKQMMDEFVNTLPDMIANIIEGIPAFIEKFIDLFPRIFDKLADKIPEIIDAFVKEIPLIAEAFIRYIPTITGTLVKVMYNVISYLINGAGQFIGKIVDGAGKFIGKILEGAGKFIQQLIDGIKGAFSGGKGGIGGIFKNPFGLFGGENSTANQISNFGGDIAPHNLISDTISSVFGKAGGGGAPQGKLGVAGGDVRHYTPAPPVQVQLIVAGHQFAKVMIDMQRLGYRLA